MCAAAARGESETMRKETRKKRNARGEKNERREKVVSREEEKDVWRSWHGELPCAAAKRERRERGEMVGRTAVYN